MGQFDGRWRSGRGGSLPQSREANGGAARLEASVQTSTLGNAQDRAPAARWRARLPTFHVVRGWLLIAVPAALLAGPVVSSWAQSSTWLPWTDGDTLTAEALNANFGALQKQIDALALVQSNPLALAPEDPRYDDLRWSLLHAAAVGACAGSPGTEFSAAQTLPRPPGQTCSDVCTSQFYASVPPNLFNLQCMAAISVGQIRTERATGSVSVGHSYRYSCNAEHIDAPLEFGEATLAATEDAHERLVNGYAQYCCCGVDVTPPRVESNESTGN